MLDASAGGLGLAVRRTDAAWTKHGALLAVLIEPGKDWFVGVRRRIFSMYAPTVHEHMVWDEAIRADKSFNEHFRHAILLEAQSLPLVAGDLLLPPGMATQGAQFDVQLKGGQQRIGITRLHIDNEYFQRVLFEPLGVTRS